MEKTTAQEQALEEGSRIEEQQAARIGELEGELTAKDSILAQALRSNKMLETENARLKAELTEALEAAKSAQADKEKALKTAQKLKESNVNIKGRFRAAEIRHRRKSRFSLLLLCYLLNSTNESVP